LQSSLPARHNTAPPRNIKCDIAFQHHACQVGGAGDATVADVLQKGARTAASNRIPSAARHYLRRLRCSRWRCENRDQCHWLVEISASMVARGNRDSAGPFMLAHREPTSRSVTGCPRTQRRRYSPGARQTPSGQSVMDQRGPFTGGSSEPVELDDTEWGE
jgi:hypothetical protein